MIELTKFRPKTMANAIANFFISSPPSKLDLNDWYMRKACAISHCKLKSKITLLIQSFFPFPLGWFFR